MNYLKLQKPQAIFLYKTTVNENFNYTELEEYLTDQIQGLNVVIKEHIFSDHSKREEVGELAQKIARLKVKDLYDPDTTFEPLHGELEFERKAILNPENNIPGILYDGFKLQSLLREFIPIDDLNLNNIHVIFTNRLIGTYDENDKRYHARVIICGFPSIISSSGVVEAPAKPREYYLIKQKLLSLGQPEIIQAQLKEQFKGRFIDYDDPRIVEILKGYIMQALFYYLTGLPFCTDKDCRLFNAHWQEEMINAQLNSGKLCRKHQIMLDEIENGI